MAENISLQRSNCNVFGLTDTVALFANEARFFLQNEVDDPPPPPPPHCFHISDISNSSSCRGRSLGKMNVWEVSREEQTIISYESFRRTSSIHVPLFAISRFSIGFPVSSSFQGGSFHITGTGGYRESRSFRFQQNLLCDFTASAD